MTTGASTIENLESWGGMRHFTICRDYKVAALEKPGELGRHETFYNM